MPHASRRTPFHGGKVTEQDRRDWQLWSQARLQDAFARGQRAQAEGRTQEALLWYERAQRLSPDDRLIGFALGIARLAAGEAAAALAGLEAVARACDLRAAWLGMAAAAMALHRPREAAVHAGHALARHALDPEVIPLLDGIAAASGAPGWSALDGAGGALHVGSATVRDIEVRLDARPVPVPLRDPAVLRLPPGWERAAQLAVTRDGVPLLGSPIDIARITRLEGFVESGPNGEVIGWAWHPADPARVPQVVLRAARGAARRLALADPAEALSDVPLARPRRLSLAAADLPEGVLHVQDEAGRDLMGSPLDPGLERRSALVAAGLQARRFAATGDGAPRGRMPPPDFLPVGADIVGTAPAFLRQRRKVDVVVPVYRHLRRTMDCLESVRASIGRDVRLHVVDDATPEPELAAALDAMARRREIRLIRNPENLGFPSSANAGLAACAGRDAVLLNSDTLVAPGWLEALREAAYAAADIGTATPLSNDASILSYPDRQAYNPPPDRDGTAQLMALARQANGGTVIDIPTANGFCMYVRRDCLDQTGMLRSDLFAQGYGEENDFCLRARHLGWRHVAVPGAFVTHAGNTSFGGARLHLMRRNLEILNRLHPGYDALIAAHIAADPLAGSRRRIDMLRWQAGRRRGGAALIITHDQGGGVERVVRMRAAAYRAAGLRPIVLRPWRDGIGCSVGDGVSDGFPNLGFRLPEERAALIALLKADRPRHAEWHHLLGHQETMRDLCASLKIPYDLFIHDYASFCPRVTLVSVGDRYCGEPDLAGCDSCIARLGGRLDEEISAGALVRRSAAELAAARAVYAPSADTARRIARHFPPLPAPQVLPWEDDRPSLSLAAYAGRAAPHPRVRQPGDRMRICILGGIGLEKGYDVLLDCLLDARRRKLALEFVVVGHTPDDDRLLAAGCRHITGEYKEDALLSLLTAQQADVVFLPSIWPETWSFTLTQAWQAGLNVVAFDIGAIAERLRATGRGALLPLNLPAAAVNDALLSMKIS